MVICIRNKITYISPVTYIRYPHTLSHRDRKIQTSAGRPLAQLHIVTHLNFQFSNTRRKRFFVLFGKAILRASHFPRSSKKGGRETFVFTFACLWLSIYHSARATSEMRPENLGERKVVSTFGMQFIIETRIWHLERKSEINHLALDGRIRGENAASPPTPFVAESTMTRDVCSELTDMTVLHFLLACDMTQASEVLAFHVFNRRERAETVLSRSQSAQVRKLNILECFGSPFSADLVETLSANVFFSSVLLRLVYSPLFFCMLYHGMTTSNDKA